MKTSLFGGLLFLALIVGCGASSSDTNEPSEEAGMEPDLSTPSLDAPDNDDLDPDGGDDVPTSVDPPDEQPTEDPEPVQDDPVAQDPVEVPEAANVVIAPGEPVPGLPDESVAGIRSIYINRAGEMAVTITYESDEVGESNLLVGTATSLTPVLTAGQTFQDRPATIRVASATGLLDDDGSLYASINFTGARSSNALFERAAGTEEFRPILETGDTLAGLLDDGEVRVIGRAGINGRGASFQINPDGNTSSGLAYWDGEKIVAVAPDFFSRVPGGQEIFRLPGTNCMFELGLRDERGYEYILHDTLPSGEVVFQARITNFGSGCPRSAVMVFDGSEYTVIAQEGGAIPGATDVVFGNVALYSVTSNGDIVYRAEIGSSANSVSYWLHTRSGEVGLLLVSGEEVEAGGRVAVIDESQHRVDGLIEVDMDRRVGARVELDNNSVAILIGAGRLSQPYPSITTPGASNLTPILVTREPLPEPFESDEFFSSVGNATLRGTAGTLFYATLSSASDPGATDTALWLHTSAGGFERIADEPDRLVSPSTSNQNSGLFVTDSGEVFNTMIANGTSRGGQVVQVLGPER